MQQTSMLCVCVFFLERFGVQAFWFSHLQHSSCRCSGCSRSLYSVLYQLRVQAQRRQSLGVGPFKAGGPAPSLPGYPLRRHHHDFLNATQPCLSLCVDARFTPRQEGKHLTISRVCMCAYSSLAYTPQTCSAWLDLPGVQDSH